MYYSSFGLLAIIHHIIINHDVLLNGRKQPKHGSHFRYRQFLNALLVFYIADALWGVAIGSGNYIIAYANTLLFFASMALLVLLWTRYVAAFLDKNGKRVKAFIAAGWVIFVFVVFHLILNFFTPVIFTITEDVQYIPYSGRNFLMGLQQLLFLIITVYSLFVALRSKGRDRVHYTAVCISGGVMSLFVLLQTLYPFAAFYTIGCFIGNCLIHVFVEEDEKREQDRIIEEAQKGKKIYSQISASLAVDYDAIYYINIESGSFLEISTSNMYREMDVPCEGENFYEETRKNAARYAHPDDREFAESMYYKETMLKNLEGKKSYSYKYRIMVGDEARYFRFTVILSDDGEHILVCDKDIQDTITAETALLEKQKTSVTFSRIAESLASNYDVIYYVDLETGDYTGYTSSNIYGELKVDESGSDFFDEAKRNATLLIHPKDRERMFTVMDKDYLLSALEGRKQFNYQYRLIVDDSVQHTRLSVRKTSDGNHLIIVVENIDNEIIKEKEHLRALNTEKELARRDELTGVRNKTAYTELEHSLQDSIDNGVGDLAFAIAVCDLNDLKKINDTKGHKAGDEYIISAAELLCRTFAHSPVFRIGGDEFVIFLNGEDYNSRKHLLDRIRKAVRINRDKRVGPIMAVGLAEYDPERDKVVSEIFERADQNMYEDKRKLKKVPGKDS